MFSRKKHEDLLSLILYWAREKIPLQIDKKIFPHQHILKNDKNLNLKKGFKAYNLYFRMVTIFFYIMWVL